MYYITAGLPQSNKYFCKFVVVFVAAVTEKILYQISATVATQYFSMF
jgi:hypothetical protein